MHHGQIGPASSAGPLTTFRKNSQIFEDGDLADGAYRIAQGWVRLQIMTEDGARQILGFLTAGDVFGFGGQVRTTAAEAVTDVKLSRIPLARLREPEMDIETGREFFAQMSRRYDELAHHVQQLMHRPAEQRILCFLAWLAHRQDAESRGGLARVPMSRTDICDHLDIAAATLSRALTQLQKEGRIVLHGPRQFVMRGPPRLGAACRAAGTVCGACATAAPRSG